MKTSSKDLWWGLKKNGTFLVHVCNASPVGGLFVLPARGLALWAGHIVAVLAAVGGVTPTEELAITPAVANPTLVRDSCAWCSFPISSKKMFHIMFGTFSASGYYNFWGLLTLPQHRPSSWWPGNNFLSVRVLKKWVVFLLLLPVSSTLWSLPSGKGGSPGIWWRLSVRKWYVIYAVQHNLSKKLTLICTHVCPQSWRMVAGKEHEYHEFSVHFFFLRHY